MNFNKAIIVGRITRDPDVRTMPSGKSVVSLGIATNRVWVGQDGNKQEAVEFHDVTAFDKLADICSKYLNKGQLVLIEGRLQTRSWQDKDGNKRYKTEIIADNMQMGPRAAGSETGQANTPRQSNETNRNITEEEIPVIEAEEQIEEKENSPKTPYENNDNQEEINVKNIPF
ncbi:MAG: single-stranded DNA-binding protein [bacterium]